MGGSRRDKVVLSGEFLGLQVFFQFGEVFRQPRFFTVHSSQGLAQSLKHFCIIVDGGRAIALRNNSTGRGNDDIGWHTRYPIFGDQIGLEIHVDFHRDHILIDRVL